MRYNTDLPHKLCLRVVVQLLWRLLAAPDRIWGSHHKKAFVSDLVTMALGTRGAHTSVVLLDGYGVKLTWN